MITKILESVFYAILKNILTHQFGVKKFEINTFLKIMKYQKMELEIQTQDSLLTKKPLETKFFKHLTRRVLLMMPMKKILPWLILSLKVVLYLNIEGTLYILGQKALS